MMGPTPINTNTRAGAVSDGPIVPHSAAVRPWLDRWPRGWFIAFSVTIASVLSLFFFSPKFWLMTRPQPGTFEWDRALSYLQQCRHPFADNVEPAVRWRLLPPLAAHALGLTGYSALVVPYLGVLALLAFWCRVAEHLLRDRISALFATSIAATTAAILSITTVYGVNDAWFLIGLVAVAAGSKWPSLVIPGLLGPWVDERFVLGWTGAIFCRWWLQERPARFRHQIAIGCLSLLPYFIVRGFYSLSVNDRGATHFLANALAIVPIYLPYARLGWWMGFRLAWLLIGIAVYDWWKRGGRTIGIIGIASHLAGWIAVTLLAADLSRSTDILLPALLCGFVALRHLAPSIRPRRNWLAACAAANLLIPFTTVTYDKIVPVWGLPLEILRLFKNNG